jgi:hypothetical protein
LSAAYHWKLEEALELVTIYLPIPAAVLGIWAAVLLTNEKSGIVAGQALLSQRKWILIQLGIFSLLFFLRGSAVVVDPIHMAPANVPSLIIISLVIWQISQYSRGKDQTEGSGPNGRNLRPTVNPVGFVCFIVSTRTMSILCKLGFASLLIISLVPTMYVLSRFAENFAWATIGSTPGFLDPLKMENVSCFPPPGLDRIRCFPIASERLEAIRYIQQHTAEDDAIFVGLDWHDNTQFVDILFYFASKRRSATKWYHFNPGVQDTREVQSEMIAELRMHRTRYIILSPQVDNIEVSTSYNWLYRGARSSGVTLLDQYIHSNYHVVASFGTTAILEYDSNEGNDRLNVRESSPSDATRPK